MNSKEKNKIRIAVCANSLAVNGISSVIMNYLRVTDLSRFQITVLPGIPVAPEYAALCRELGVSVIPLPERKTSAVRYYAALYRQLARGQFDIFHIHGNSATITAELFLARLCGIPVRIAHCHNTQCSRIFIHNMLAPLFPRVYTHAFACGKDAGNWMFRDGRYTVVPNGFDTDRFRFQPEMRRTVRSRYQIGDRFVIGHIGRFNAQKNHAFLLEIFRCTAARTSDAVLLLAGTGPDYDQVMDMIRCHPYRERIIVCGETSQPEALYAAMDVFVLPSLYEGLPVVLLEAQINGLPCIVSDTVTQEAALGKDFYRMSLKESPGTWASAILNTKHRSGSDRTAFCARNRDAVARYDIRKNGKFLETLYLDALRDTRTKKCVCQEDLS